MEKVKLSKMPVLRNVKGWKGKYCYISSKEIQNIKVILEDNGLKITDEEISNFIKDGISSKIIRAIKEHPSILESIQ